MKEIKPSDAAVVSGGTTPDITVIEEDDTPIVVESDFNPIAREPTSTQEVGGG